MKNALNASKMRLIGTILLVIAVVFIVTTCSGGGRDKKPCSDFYGTWDDVEGWEGTKLNELRFIILYFPR
jgi:hypothetical protein